jgi:hypothetical protein
VTLATQRNITSSNQRLYTLGCALRSFL